MDIDRDGVLSFDEIVDGMQAYGGRARERSLSQQGSWRSRYSASPSASSRNSPTSSRDGRSPSPPRSRLSPMSSFMDSGPPSPTSEPSSPKPRPQSPYRQRQDGASPAAPLPLAAPMPSDTPMTSQSGAGQTVSAPPCGLLRLYDSMLRCMKVRRLWRPRGACSPIPQRCFHQTVSPWSHHLVAVRDVASVVVNPVVWAPLQSAAVLGLRV